MQRDYGDECGCEACRDKFFTDHEVTVLREMMRPLDRVEPGGCAPPVYATPAVQPEERAASQKESET